MTASPPRLPDRAPGHPPGHPAADPLDDPVGASLFGPHASFAERRGNVRRYPVDVARFAAMPPHPAPTDWDDLAGLTGPGAVVPLAGVEGSPPVGWEVVLRGAGTQLTGAAVATAATLGVRDPEIVRLTAADAVEMLALAERTKPGPFFVRTVELGTYLGVRRAGRLVAMAGERLHPPGWTEISAVCTDTGHRGQGLASRLVLAVAAGIHARGETPFLHVTDGNTAALRLYEALGFQRRRRLTFLAVRLADVRAG